MRIRLKNRRVLAKTQRPRKATQPNQQQNQKHLRLPRQFIKITQGLPEEKTDKNKPSQHHPPRSLQPDLVHSKNSQQNKIAVGLQQRHPIHSISLRQVRRADSVALKINDRHPEEIDEPQQKTNETHRTSRKSSLHHRSQKKRVRRKTITQIRQHLRNGQTQRTRTQRPTPRNERTVQKRRKRSQQKSNHPLTQIENIKEQLQERKRELLEAKRANTKVINDITELGEHENELKKKLDSTNKQLFVSNP